MYTGVTPISLDFRSDDGLPLIEPIDNRTPEDAFERQWALTVLRHAIDRLRQHERADGRLDQFEKLKGLLTGLGPDTTYTRLAEDLNQSEAAVKMTVRRLRKRFGKTLRAEVAGTIDRPQDVDQEVRHLLTVLRS